jgi:hypothetical protein
MAKKEIKVSPRLFAFVKEKRLAGLDLRPGYTSPWFATGKINVNEVARIVKKGLESQFETYSWEHMIDDLDLTREEKAWAKRHTEYAVRVI